MAHFMLLLHHSTTGTPYLEPAQVQGVIARYVAWSDAMQSRGHLVRGDKLQDGTGRVLRRKGPRTVVHDGPFAEAKEMIGGYYVLDARDWDQAVELAGSCPHLELGGTIEVRAIEQVRA